MAGITAIVGGIFPLFSKSSIVVIPSRVPIQVCGTPGVPGKSSTTWYELPMECAELSRDLATFGDATT